ncbi:RNA-binding domain-containing protein [Methanocaldococcus villosus]|uniref:RNA-binding domain-containing protein n=1 Tax=Methanocaldococcus villosus TaxID=667126 RepID=UPI00191C17FF
MKVIIKSKVKPTEDKYKVKKAILNIFPKANLRYSEKDFYGKWEGETKDVERFKELIRSQAILDTARMILEEKMDENSTRFYLNKQAAFVKAVNFDIDVHGGIYVKIIAEKGEDILKIIKDIAPRTKGGVIIEEEEEEIIEEKG